MTAMSVKIDRKDLVAEILNGILPLNKSIFTLLDALRKANELLTLIVARSRLLREKQKWNLQKSYSSKTALVGSPIKQAKAGQIYLAIFCSDCR